MIDKSHRFQGHGSLRFVYQRGETLRGPFCSLKYIHNRRRSTYRVAVVVSKKVHKSAVVRNRIRRRIYEIVRCEERGIAGPFDLVITAYSDQLAVLPHDQLRKAILEKLEKASVLKRTAPTGVTHHDIVEPKEN